jgi:hypothetical protein
MTEEQLGENWNGEGMKGELSLLRMTVQDMHSN